MEKAIYPDFNCNNEIYINSDFLKVETLSPLTNLPSGGVIEHTEDWFLKEVETDESEASINEKVLADIIHSFSLL